MNIWKLCPGKGFWRILLNSTIDVLGYLVCHGLEPTYLKYHSGKEYVGFGVTVRESGIMANLGHIKAFVLKKSCSKMTFYSETCIHCLTHKMSLKSINFLDW